MEPCLGSDIHDNLSIYEADISIRALVKNPRQFLDDKNNFNQQIIKAGISQEIIDKLFSDPKDPVLLGSIEIISLGSSNYIQVVGALQYDSSGIMERIGKYILEIYGTRAHKNLDGQQLNIDDYKKLKDLYKDLISQHIETLENQNEDRDTVRKVINLRDERIASLQEKIN
jgi:hypothetical protein